MIPEPEREFLRHVLATLAYRGGKVLRDPPESIGDFRIADGTRTPAEILAHIGDLLDWALTMARAEPTWIEAADRSWENGVTRFFAGLERLDAFLASDHPLASPPERIFQGPFADALTHVGQIALLRRLAGGSVRGENYYRADITTGHVGREQPAPNREFD